MRRTITTLAIAAAATLAIAVPASAHVTAQPPEQPAGGFTTVTLRVPNERAEPTTRLEVKFPENVHSARVKPVPGWSYEVKMAKLDEPIEGSHGEEITESIDTITWTGGRINDGEYQEFELSLQMPEEGELGDLLFFPTNQTYEGGEVVGWTERPASEDDDAELERPAPKVTLVATGDSHGGGGDDHADEDEADSAASADADDEGDDAGSDETTLYALSIAALVIALLALLVGWKRRD